MSNGLILRPHWIRSKLPSGNKYVDMKIYLQSSRLHTVCEEARCPNLSECWGIGTATIMIMGDKCSRRFRFCSVTVAKAIKDWGLKYVVITRVCRDDLRDGGAEHMSNTIKASKMNQVKLL